MRFADFALFESCGPASFVSKSTYSVANQHSTKLERLLAVGLPHY